MQYLLDTCIVIEHLRGKRPISVSWLENGCAMSIISQAELLYGAELSNRPEYHNELISQLIKQLQIKIINLDLKTISVFAQQSAQLKKNGNGVDHFDGLIAATAIQHGLTLVTYNHKHFERFEKLKLT